MTDESSLYVLVKGNLEEVINFKLSGPYNSLKKILVDYKNLSIIFYIYFFKGGEIVGLHSFITDQKRKTSIVSKDFSTVYEIKKEDFLKIIKNNTHDYVK